MAVACLLGLHVSLLSSSAQQSLPYDVDFETAEGFSLGDVDGQVDWNVSAGLADVTNATAYAGSNALILKSGSDAAVVEQSFTQLIGESVVFVDFFARLVADSSVSAASAFAVESSLGRFVKVGADGVIEVLDGDGSGGGTWVSTGVSVALDASDRALAWERLTLRLDFADDTWDLYLDGVIAAIDLGFAQSSSAYLSSLAITGHLAADGYFDYLEAGTTNPLFTDQDQDGMEDAWESAHGMSIYEDDRDFDCDDDGLKDIEEYFFGTKPNSKDTDRDGLDDPDELILGRNPTTAENDSFLLGLGGLRLFLKADTGVTLAGSYVSSWADQSVNGHNVTQSNSAYRPQFVSGVINGQPVVRMNGANQFLTGVTTSAFKPTKITVMAVYKLSSAGSYPRIIVQPYHVSGWNPPYSSWELSAGAGSTGSPFAQVTTGGVDQSITSNASVLGDFALGTFTYDGSASAMYINGTLTAHRAVSGPIDYGSSGSFHIGNSPHGDYLNGDVAELLVFDRALSAAELEAVGLYLHGKYALPGVVVPSMPVNVRALPVSPSQASVTWESGPTSSDGNVYAVERRQGSAAYEKIADVAMGSSYFDSDLLAGTTYTYRVSARSYEGSSIAAESDALTTHGLGTPEMELADLKLWLKADIGLLKNEPGDVQLWLDQSGHGNNVTQSNSTYRPQYVSGVINGQPVVRLNGSNQFLTGVTTSAFKPTNITVMAVYKLSSAGSYPRIIVQPYHASGWNPPYSAWELSAGAGSTGSPFAQVTTGGVDQSVTSNTSVLGEFALATFTYDGDTSALYVNETPTANRTVSGPIGYGLSGSFHIGNSPHGDYLNGDVAELLVFDRALSAVEVMMVGYYINRKYEVTAPGAFGNYVDSNFNGLSDTVDVTVGFDPYNMDTDGDGINNATELLAGTNQFESDSDQDGVDDDDDYYPLDPTRWDATELDPEDETGPVVTIESPDDAVLN